MAVLPTLSIVIPTYNCAPLLRPTLDSLAAQDYPKGKLELLLVDGGSTDTTRVVGKQCGFRVIDNPARSNLYGLPLGFKAARGDLVLHLDDDNVLDRPDWLQRMVEPFSDPSIIAAEPLYYTASKTENYITRYVALLGADDPLIVYAGFHDKFSLVTNSWTGVPRHEEDHGPYLAVTFTDLKRIPTLACNAFMCRREALVAASRTPWLHIDGAVRLLQPGHRRWAKVKVGIINHHAPGIGSFFVKKIRRLQTRSREAGSFEYRYPLARTQLVWLLARSLLILPLCWDALRGFYRKPDWVWALHPVFTLGTILTYAWGILMLGFKGTVSSPIIIRTAKPL